MAVFEYIETIYLFIEGLVYKCLMTVRLSRDINEPNIKTIPAFMEFIF